MDCLTQHSVVGQNVWSCHIAGGVSKVKQVQQCELTRPPVAGDIGESTRIMPQNQSGEVQIILLEQHGAQ